WDRFVCIQQRLADNRSIAAALGAPRAGPSLLGGLWVCGRCGRRLLAAYSGKANRLRYACMQATMSYGAPGCLSLAGTGLDDVVAGQGMEVLAPASWRLS